MKVEVAVLVLICLMFLCNMPYVLYGRKATLNLNVSRAQAQELCESRRGSPGLPVPNKRYGPCGRKQH